MITLCYVGKLKIQIIESQYRHLCAFTNSVCVTRRTLMSLCSHFWAGSFTVGSCQMKYTSAVRHEIQGRYEGRSSEQCTYTHQKDY